MADKLRIKILTAEKTICDREAGQVVAPGWEGEFGILPDHSPFICALQTGYLEIRSGHKSVEPPEAVYAVHGGFMRIYKDDVLILATAAESKGDIDADRAHKAQQRAEEKLKDRARADIDFIRAEAALKRALIRLRIHSGRQHEVETGLPDGSSHH